MSTERPGESNKPATITIGLVYDQPLDIGGVETHLVTLCRLSEKQGFHYVIFAPFTERFRDFVAPLGVELVSWENWSIFDLRIPLKLRSQFKNHGVDVAHIHSPSAGVHGRLAAKLAGIPTLVTVHLPVYLYHGRKSTFRANLGRMLYTWLDRTFNYLLTDEIIYVSKSILDQCLKIKLSPVRISSFIPNGVDINLKNKLPPREVLRDRYGAEPEECILIFAGRLEDQKGVDLLPALISGLIEEHPNLKLWIVGEGPLRYSMENQMQEMGLNQRVVFWGYQQDIGSFLKASDIFILPSRYEAMPFVLLEALAAGLPCIVTDTGDAKILVKPGVNGALTSVDRLDEFQNAVRILASDINLRAQQGGESYKIALDYDEKKSVSRILDTYKNITTRSILK